MEVKVTTLSESDLEALLTKANKRGRIEAQEEIKTKYDTPQELTDLLETHFPSYNTEHWVKKLRQAIKGREVGRLDRFNKYMVSYTELYNYLFKC